MILTTEEQAHLWNTLVFIIPTEDGVDIKEL